MIGVVVDIDTPSELKVRLMELFPDVSTEFEEDELYSKERAKNLGFMEPETFHRVWQVFSPVALKELAASSEKTVKKFCKLVNELVEFGGDHENAVSTCFLEHASQIGIRTVVKPYLNATAAKELR